MSIGALDRLGRAEQKRYFKKSCGRTARCGRPLDSGSLSQRRRGRWTTGRANGDQPLSGSPISAIKTLRPALAHARANAAVVVPFLWALMRYHTLRTVSDVALSGFGADEGEDAGGGADGDATGPAVRRAPRTKALAVPVSRHRGNFSNFRNRET
jgi:hypothetical protein